MKILTKLEKNKSFWYLLGLSLIFFFLRLPSLIEPNWYGDEGIYQVIGQAINKGRLLYTDTWDNKPPLLYLVYAIFNGEQFWVRLFSMVVGIFSTWAFFAISTLLFKELRTRIISTLIFVLLFAVPLLEGNIANAENFMILPVLLAGILIYKISNKIYFSKTKRYILTIAGLLIGIAFLFKIVALFDFAAFGIFLMITNFPDRFSFSSARIKKLFSSSKSYLIPFSVGFIFPILGSVFFFFIQGAFSDFMTATFFSNVDYVGWKNNFIFPQGLLVLKLMLLAGVIFLAFRKRKHLAKSELFIFLWFAFSVFSTYFSGRPYTHYVLMTLSSFCLLLGLFLDTKKPRLKYAVFLLLIFTSLILNNTFKFNFGKTFRYYDNAISFLSGKKDVLEYQSFFDNKTPRDYEIASFIKSHTTDDDSVFIWGDSAQIYSLSGKLPPGKYTVAYHISQYPSALEETQMQISKTRPKYIVVLNEARAFPFNITSYENRLFFEEAVVYERSF